MNKLVEAQLAKVQTADLSQFDKENNAYFIPQKKSIKIEENNCYLIKLSDTIFSNEALKTNWNNGNMPKYSYLKIDVSKIIAKMIKVVGVGYDFEKQEDIPYFWNGWLTTNEIEVLEKL